MRLNKSQEIFFALLRAGLWEKEARISPYGEVDYNEIMCLAEEQSVVGLVTAGLGHVTDIKVPKETVLQYVGRALQFEQQNIKMNGFISSLINRMRDADINSLLVKGQGIAQCYERPLWRASGDVDLYLSERNYIKARSFLRSIASHIDVEDKKKLHQGMSIDSWVVELHGTLYTDFSSKVNKGLDEIHHRLFYGGEVRSWNNSGTTIFLPSANEDVLIVFTHILNHLFIEGVGLRQICDWCRLLWTFRDTIDIDLLRDRLGKMGLLRIWKVLASLAVNELGMPEDAMPFYVSEKYVNKSRKLLEKVLESGNFGHNKDLSYRTKYSGLTYKAVSFWRRLCDFSSFSFIFPIDAPRFFVSYLFHKV